MVRPCTSARDISICPTPNSKRKSVSCTVRSQSRKVFNADDILNGSYIAVPRDVSKKKGKKEKVCSDGRKKRKALADSFAHFTSLIISEHKKNKVAKLTETLPAKIRLPEFISEPIDQTQSSLDTVNQTQPSLDNSHLVADKILVLTPIRVRNLALDRNRLRSRGDLSCATSNHISHLPEDVTQSQSQIDASASSLILSFKNAKRTIKRHMGKASGKIESSKSKRKDSSKLARSDLREMLRNIEGQNKLMRQLIEKLFREQEETEMKNKKVATDLLAQKEEEMAAVVSYEQERVAVLLENQMEVREMESLVQKYIVERYEHEMRVDDQLLELSKMCDGVVSRRREQHISTCIALNRAQSDLRLLTFLTDVALLFIFGYSFVLGSIFLF